MTDLLSATVVYYKDLVLLRFLDDDMGMPGLTIRCFSWYCLSNRIEWSLARVTPFLTLFLDFSLETLPEPTSTWLFFLLWEGNGIGGREIFMLCNYYRLSHKLIYSQITSFANNLTRNCPVIYHFQSNLRKTFKSKPYLSKNIKKISHSSIRHHSCFSK